MTEIETVPVKVEHLTEGMKVKLRSGLGFGTVWDTRWHYNPFGSDGWTIVFTDAPDMWLQDYETVEVEA